MPECHTTDNVAVEKSPQVEHVENKQVIVVKPTDENFAYFCRFRNGESVKQIAESEGKSRQAIQYHINQVKSFLGDSWQKFVLTDMQLEYANVKPQWDKLVKSGDKLTINKYFDKLVYPDRSSAKQVKPVNQTILANKLQVNNYNRQDVNAIDADVEVID